MEPTMGLILFVAAGYGLYRLVKSTSKDRLW